MGQFINTVASKYYCTYDTLASFFSPFAVIVSRNWQQNC